MATEERGRLTYWGISQDIKRSMKRAGIAPISRYRTRSPTYVRTLTSRPDVVLSQTPMLCRKSRGILTFSDTTARGPGNCRPAQ